MRPVLDAVGAGAGTPMQTRLKQCPDAHSSRSTHAPPFGIPVLVGVAIAVAVAVVVAVGVRADAEGGMTTTARQTHPGPCSAMPGGPG